MKRVGLRYEDVAESFLPQVLSHGDRSRFRPLRRIILFGTDSVKSGISLDSREIYRIISLSEEARSFGWAQQRSQEKVSGQRSFPLAPFFYGYLLILFD